MLNIQNDVRAHVIAAVKRNPLDSNGIEGPFYVIKIFRFRKNMCKFMNLLPFQMWFSETLVSCVESFRNNKFEYRKEQVAIKCYQSRYKVQVEL